MEYSHEYHSSFRSPVKDQPVQWWGESTAASTQPVSAHVYPSYPSNFASSSPPCAMMKADLSVPHPATRNITMMRGRPMSMSSALYQHAPSGSYHVPSSSYPVPATFWPLMVSPPPYPHLRRHCSMVDSLLSPTQPVLPHQQIKSRGAKQQQQEDLEDVGDPLPLDDPVPQEEPQEEPLPLFPSTKNLLHRVCFLSLGVIRVLKVLKVDPSAAGRAETVDYPKKVWSWNPQLRQMVSRVRKVQAPYKYPLHLVILSAARVSSKAFGSAVDFDEDEDDTIFCSSLNERLDDCLRILQVLLKSAPDVLLETDGSFRASSLAILIKEWAGSCNRDKTLLQHCLEFMERMVRLQPSLVIRKDRHDNSILHIACQCGAPLNIVIAVYCLDPAALTRKNRHGLTPLEIAAQRMAGPNKKAQESVVNFLTDRHDEMQQHFLGQHMY